MALIMCCYSLDGTIPVIYQEDNHKYSLIERKDDVGKCTDRSKIRKLYGSIWLR